MSSYADAARRELTAELDAQADIVAENRALFEREMATPLEFAPRPAPPPPRRTRRWYIAACWTAAVVLVALAPPLPHEPWVLGGFAAGYLTAVLDRALRPGTGRRRAR